MQPGPEDQGREREGGLQSRVQEPATCSKMDIGLWLNVSLMQGALGEGGHITKAGLWG